VYVAQFLRNFQGLWALPSWVNY